MRPASNSSFRYREPPLLKGACSLFLHIAFSFAAMVVYGVNNGKTSAACMHAPTAAFCLDRIQSYMGDNKQDCSIADGVRDARIMLATADSGPAAR